MYRFFVAAVLAAISIVATAETYRCTVGGKTLLTDKPCDGNVAQQGTSAASATTLPGSADSSYSTPYGEWRGQAQFQANVGGTVQQDAHAVVPLVIAIDAQGKVTGAAPEAGCQIKGIATPGVVPTMLNLDVTLSGCRYAGYNRRMGGYVALYQAQKHAQLSLNGNHIPARQAVAIYDIKSTMRR